MAENVLARLFEHNNWANLQLIQACKVLEDQALDARPTGTPWSVRLVLLHLVEAQQGYLSLLTLPPEERTAGEPAYAELTDAARTSGAALLALARDEHAEPLQSERRTRDGYLVQPWVVMLQAINHATDHRRQVCDLLRAQGINPPRLAGWAFAEVMKALSPID